MNRPARAIPFQRHCGTAPSGAALRVELYDFNNVIAAWAIMGDANPEDPTGALLVEREMAISADEDRKSTEPRADRVRAVLVALHALCSDEPPGAELEGDWNALAALAWASQLEPSP